MNEDQGSQMLGVMRALACPDSIAVTVFRGIKDLIWCAALFLIGWLIHGMEESFFQQSGAPAQCAIGIYSTAWIITTYVIARGIDAVFSSCIESLRNSARKKAIKNAAISNPAGNTTSG